MPVSLNWTVIIVAVIGLLGTGGGTDCIPAAPVDAVPVAPKGEA